MKRELVIIPGAVNPKFTEIRLVRPITKYVRTILGLSPEIKFRYASFIKSMNKKYTKIHFVEYQRDLFKIFSKANNKIVIDRLSNIKNNYDVVCFSFGGHLIQEAIKNKNIKKPDNIILIFSLNLNKKINFPANTRVINLYSNKDTITKYSSIILSFGMGNQHLANAKNIFIENMHHSDIEGEKKIENGPYLGLTGFELIEKMLS